MVILQFQFSGLSDDEREIIPEYCDYLKEVVLAKLNTKINRKKISLRLKYIEEEATWIDWVKNKKYNITVQDIIDSIYEAIIVVPYKNNLWKLEVNSNVCIPNSYTSIDRLIRFLNYGDLKCRATGIFTNIENEYNHKQLNAIWNYQTLKLLGHPSESKIIAK